MGISLDFLGGGIAPIQSISEDNMQSQNQQNIKFNNTKLVLKIIKDNYNADISRADIAKITHMSATSISRIVDILISESLVKEGAYVNCDRAGRKGTGLRANDDGLITAGVSIDSDNVSMCIMDFSDRIIASRTIALEYRPYEPEEILNLIGSMYRFLCLEIPYAKEQIESVGISCIGNIDYKKNIIYFAPQFGWSNIDFGERAGHIFQKPIFMENDIKAAIMSLVHQEKKYLKEDVTYLSIGTGVGSATMFQGKIARGNNNAFGEVGHVIIQPKGRKCDCGQRGCVQTTLTRNSLIEECREEGHNITRVEQIYELYRSKTDWTVKLIDKTAGDLAVLIRNLVYMYNTNYILIGGAMIMDFPELFELAKEKLTGLIHTNLLSDLNIIRVKTRNNSMAGAAFIAQANSMHERLLEMV